MEKSIIIHVGVVKYTKRRICLFVLKFYSPVNPLVPCRVWSVYLQYSQRDIPIDLGRHHDQFLRHGDASSCLRDERDS